MNDAERKARREALLAETRAACECARMIGDNADTLLEKALRRREKYL